MNINKIKSYYGFALKSGSLAIGIDSILKAKCKVIVMSQSLAKNSKDKCLSKADNSRVIELEQETIFEITQNPKILAFGVTDGNLANAILNNIE